MSEFDDEMGFACDCIASKIYAKLPGTPGRSGSFAAKFLGNNNALCTSMVFCLVARVVKRHCPAHVF